MQLFSRAGTAKPPQAETRSSSLTLLGRGAFPCSVLVLRPTPVIHITLSRFSCLQTKHSYTIIAFWLLPLRERRTDNADCKTRTNVYNRSMGITCKLCGEPVKALMSVHVASHGLFWKAGKWYVVADRRKAEWKSN